MFLSVIGADTYGLLKNLVTTTKPSEMSYNELKTALLAHYRPQPPVIAECFKFQKCNQKEGEWPFIVASLRHTCAIIMLSNQHLDMPHL